MHPDHAQDEHLEAPADAAVPPAARLPIWERFEEASRTIPDPELDCLSTDLAGHAETVAMRRFFADTFYRVALLFRRDTSHARVTASSHGRSA